MSLIQNHPDPSNWRWTKVGDTWQPTWTDLPVAAEACIEMKVQMQKKNAAATDAGACSDNLSARSCVIAKANVHKYRRNILTCKYLKRKSRHYHSSSASFKTD